MTQQLYKVDASIAFMLQIRNWRRRKTGCYKEKSCCIALGLFAPRLVSSYAMVRSISVLKYDSAVYISKAYLIFMTVCSLNHVCVNFLYENLQQIILFPLINVQSNTRYIKLVAKAISQKFRFYLSTCLVEWNILDISICNISGRPVEKNTTQSFILHRFKRFGVGIFIQPALNL